MPRSKYTDQQRTEALDLYAREGPTAVEDQLDIPKSTVRGWARKQGVQCVRNERTRAATEARMVDLEKRRADLAASLLDDAEKLRRQLWEPCVIHNFGGKDNTYNSHEVPEPTFRDKQYILTSVAIAVDKSLKLDLHDQDDSQGLAAVDAWLRGVIHGEGEAA